MIEFSNLKNSVIVRLNGGLGNQMFQYAAGLALAESKKKSLYLDLSLLKFSKFQYQLNNFNLPQNSLINNDVVSDTPRKLLEKFNKKFGWIHEKFTGIYYERNFDYSDNIFSINKDVIVLNGYFQSPLYFSHIEEIIRKRFLLTVSHSEDFKYWAAKIFDSKNSVALHIRRGDYLSEGALLVHGLLDKNYYERALQLISKIIGSDLNIFIFSDDHKYASYLFKNIPRLNFVKTSDVTHCEDMFLMSQCNHNIIANSTYSWWGAWLNKNKNKHVIAPAQWFTSSFLKSTNVLNLFPNDWILLK